MHGTGTYKYKASDDVYSGQFSEGLKNGQGIYEFGKDQSRLDGLWERGEFKTGKRQFKDAGSYQGSFENGQPAGPGRFNFITAGGVAIVQEGEYKSDAPVAEDEENAEPPIRTWHGKPVYCS